MEEIFFLWLHHLWSRLLASSCLFKNSIGAYYCKSFCSLLFFNMVVCFIDLNLVFLLSLILTLGTNKFTSDICFVIWNYLVTADNTSQVNNKTIYSIGPRLKAFSDWLFKVMVSGNLESMIPAATRDYAPFVEELWRDAAIQATYNRRSELDLLPGVATYFLERVKATSPWLHLLSILFFE